MTTVLHEQAETACTSGQAEGDELWLSGHDLERTTGWAMKPEGLCKGELCVPVPPGRRAEFVRGDALNPTTLNVTAIWRYMGHPVAHDAAGETWVLGTGATDRASTLRSLEAPDFALPDLAGDIGTLSRHRGRKVLLATWASW